MNLTPLLFVSLIVLVTRAGALIHSDEASINRLYSYVIDADYVAAVKLTYDLEAAGNGGIIRSVVNRLIEYSRKNVLDYAYKLWISHVVYSNSVVFGKEIVKTYFPAPIKEIMSSDRIRLINIQDGLAVKLGWKTDSINDRQAYGDSNDRTSDRIRWKFIPYWIDNRLYFTIYNTKHQQYLKLEIATDGDGEHKAWGADRRDTYRHLWYLQPVKYENFILFYIYNRQYGHALKLGRHVDSDGDRILWGHNGVIEGHPELFGWFIGPI